MHRDLASEPSIRDAVPPDSGYSYLMLAERHQALRDDVSLLGRLLGDVLRTVEGSDLFEAVEAVRTLAKRARGGRGGGGAGAANPNGKTSTRCSEA